MTTDRSFPLTASLAAAGLRTLGLLVWSGTAICASAAQSVAQAEMGPPAGEWQIVDEAGNQLGILILDRERNGHGEIAASHPGGAAGSVTIHAFSTSTAAFDIILNPVGVTLPEVQTARLLFERPDGEDARGSFFGTDGFLRPIRMRWIGSGESDAVDDYDPGYPAIGIWRPEYEIVNVPPGISLPLREGPATNASVTGSLAAGARGVWIRECLPDIETAAFDAADIAGRMALLSGSWCEVEQDGQVGFLPGFHLRPLD